MVHLRRAVACSSALAVSLVLASGPARAADPGSTAVAAGAVGWINTQQIAGGGFGFGTADAALSIAEQAQSGPSWSTAEALAAVQSVTNGGKTPLDALVAELASPGFDAAGSAGKAILLSAEPFGIDPSNFGGIDLVSRLGGCSVDSDPTFNGLLYVLLAERFTCGSPSTSGLAAVRAAQRADGGWNFLGDQEPDIGSDNDTTAVAVEALIAGGADASDSNVHEALVFFAQTLQANGAWQSFGSDDPNSTALAVIGITAAGFDPESSCWRDTMLPATAGTPYTTPDAWLRSQQQPDGHIASGTDGTEFASTYATSQTVEGLLRSWLPAFRAAPASCGSPVPVVDTTSPVAGGTITVSGGGFAASTELRIELHSDPVLLGTVLSHADGSYSGTVVIPVDTVPGEHSIVVSGLDPNGQPRSVEVAITVTAPISPVPVQPNFPG
jgi:hypothetical protein